MLATPPSTPSRSLLAGTVAVVLLLVLLATLQYRWLGQISEADQARLRASAQTRADEFARDFDREITRAYLRLRFDAGAARTRDAARFLERRARFVAMAGHPGLVKDVRLASATGQELWRIDPDTGAFVEERWPPALAVVHERIRELSEGSSRPGSSPAPPPRPGRRGGFDFIDEAALALVSPIPDFERGDRPREGAVFNIALRFAGYTIVTLDPDYVRDQLLPGLARRHFGLDEDAEYAVLVTAQDDHDAVVFRSTPRDAVPGPGDASAQLFGLRMDEASDDDLSALGMPRPAPSPRGRGEARAFGRRGGGPAREHEGRWRLVATHRAGSVDHVVAVARTRNLAISALILALLGVSVVLVVVSAQRARRLADRQLEFVAGVSHELRTPVSVIASAGENLADGLVSDRDMARRYGRVVRDEARRLVEMVEQVLDFAGSYAGRRVYRFETIDLAELLRECVDAARPSLDEVEGEATVEVGLAVPPVRADRAALRRAVLNLVGNAIKYGGETPRLAVRVNAMPPRGGRRQVELVVEDHGLGIAPAELGRVFEPFFRGEEARSRQIRGSGLGLSLVKRIVEAHSGRIRVASAEGGGTTFTVTLPAEGGATAHTATGEESHDTPHTAH